MTQQQGERGHTGEKVEPVAWGIWADGRPHLMYDEEQDALDYVEVAGARALARPVYSGETVAVLVAERDELGAENTYLREELSDKNLALNNWYNAAVYENAEGVHLWKDRATAAESALAAANARVERLADELESSASLLEVMAESAADRGDTVEQSMMEVMAGRARAALTGGNNG